MRLLTHLSVSIGLSITSLSSLASMNQYEIPESTKEAHEVSFYNQSAQYEDSLKNLQIVLVVDKSGSQQAPDEHPLKANPGKGMLGSGWTQWDNTFVTTKYLAESLFEYDADGNIPVIFFGHHAKEINTKNIGEMLMNFKKHKPSNETTNLLEALTVAFKNHVTTKNKEERVLFIVITDGAPNSGQESKVKSLIKEKITKKDPKGETLNVLFIRIGDDPGAMNFLQDLDDCKEVGQNVDTKSDNMMYKMGPKNLILNAIYEHLDNQYSE